MLTSKKHGGAGIGSIGAANKALLCKWLWRFVNEKNRFWVKCMVAIHHSNNRIDSVPS